MEAEEQKKMTERKAADDESSFKNRINPPAIYEARRDSEGESFVDILSVSLTTD